MTQRFSVVAQLTQLAVLFMPRTFVCGTLPHLSHAGPVGWGENSLEQDLVAFAVLRDPNSALFVYYEPGLDHVKKRRQDQQVDEERSLVGFWASRSCALCMSRTHRSPLKDKILRISGFHTTVHPRMPR